MKLGVVARSVIVASCFWMIGGTYYIADRIDRAAERQADAAYRGCMSISPEGYDCWQGREKIYRAHSSELAGGLWGFAATSAAIMLALILLAAAILYGAVRWIVAGRKVGDRD